MMAQGLFTAGTFTGTQEIMMAEGLFSAGTSITQDLNHDGTSLFLVRIWNPIQLESCLGEKHFFKVMFIYIYIFICIFMFVYIYIFIYLYRNMEIYCLFQEFQAWYIYIFGIDILLSNKDF